MLKGILHILSPQLLAALDALGTLGSSLAGLLDVLHHVGGQDAAHCGLVGQDLTQWRPIRRWQQL